MFILVALVLIAIVALIIASVAVHILFSPLCCCCWPQASCSG